MHQAHIKLLDKLFARLVTHNVKINLQKCFFRSLNVAYLGFRLTEEGVKPGTDKLKAVSKATCWLFLETNLSDHWISIIRPSDSNFFAAKMIRVYRLTFKFDVWIELI